jgi:SPP1 family predicted phage head-tail adaptor
MSGREYFAAQQAQVEVTTNIRMRFIVGISALMRIERENGELFDIINVIDVEGKHKELKLLCRRFIKE